MQKDHIGNDVRILSHQIHRWIENAPNKKKIDSVTGANAWIIGYISDKTDNRKIWKAVSRSPGQRLPRW